MCKLSPFYSKALKFGYNHNKHSDFIHIKVLKGHIKRSKVKYDDIV